MRRLRETDAATHTRPSVCVMRASQSADQQGGAGSRATALHQLCGSRMVSAAKGCHDKALLAAQGGPGRMGGGRARHNERRRKERADPVERASENAYERQRSRAKRRDVWAAANRLCAICDVNPVPFGPGGRRFCGECKAAHGPGVYWCDVCGCPRPPRRRLCDTCRALRKRSRGAVSVLA